MKKSFKKYLSFGFLAVLATLAIVFAPDFSDATGDSCPTDICVVVPDVIAMNLPANTNEAEIDELTVENVHPINDVIISGITAEKDDSNFDFVSYFSDFKTFMADSKKIAIAFDDGTQTHDLSSGSYAPNIVISSQETKNLKFNGRSSVSTTNITESDNVQPLKITLTIEGPSAKAILTSDGNLDFVYDAEVYAVGNNYVYDNGTSHTSQITNVYSVPTESSSGNNPAWMSNDNVLTANFNSNFHNFKPTSTFKWFADEHYLSTITNIDNLNTSEVKTMSKMFANAGYDSNSFVVDLSSLETDNVVDMSRMFYYTGYNSEIWTIGDISEWNVGNVKSFDRIFYYAAQKTAKWDIGDIDDWDVSLVENMDCMFYDAGHSATEWNIGDLSGWNTVSVNNMSHTFYRAGYSTKDWSVGDLSEWKTGKVTNMYSMFYEAGHSSDEWSVGTLSKWDTSKVTDMSNMFYGTAFSATVETDSKTLNLDLSNWDTSNVTGMRGMFAFSGCQSEQWAVGDISGWNVEKVETMAQMFDGIGGRYIENKVQTLDLSGWVTTSLTNTIQMFKLARVTTIYVGAGWNMDNVVESEGMFDATYRLVGGAGSSYITYGDRDVSFAHIDGGTENPGYLTDAAVKNLTAKAILLEDKSLNFLYDNIPFDTEENTYNNEYSYEKNGIDLAIDYVYEVPIESYFNIGAILSGIAEYSVPKWIESDGISETITSVYFDESFADYKPNSLATWFMSMDNLEEIYGLEHLNTSNVTDMSLMFFSDESLKSLDLSSFNTSKVKNMTMMFEGMYNAISLDVSSFDTSKVEDMSCMFFNMESITSLDVSNFDTTNVKSMASMFRGMKALESLDLSNFNTTNVTNMGGMFSYSDKLTSLDLSSFDTSNVTDMDEMFRNASSLTILDLSSFDVSKVTEMRNMFYYASSLETIYVSADTDWRDGVVSEARNMFLANSKLVGGAGTEFCNTNLGCAHVDGGEDDPGYFTYKCIENCSAKAILSNDGMLNFVYDNKNYGSGTTEDPFITDYSYRIDSTAPTQTPTITAVYSVPLNGGTPAWTSSYQWCTDHECTNYREDITSVNFDQSFYSVKPTSTTHWFYFDGYLSSITNAGNLNTENVTSMYEMFYCAGKNSESFSLNLSSWDTSNVISMRGMFGHAGYNSTTWSVSGLSSWDTSSVTYMDFMFFYAGYNSTSFSLNLSSWDTSSVTNMYSMFDGAGYYSTSFSLDLSSWDTSSVTDMSYMFDSAGKNSTSFSLNLSSWDTSKVTDMDWMFARAGANSESFSLDLSSLDTSSVTDMYAMFESAGKKSTSFSLDLSSWDTSNVTNMSSMFSYAGQNSESFSLDLSSWDTSNVTNMSGMFSYAGSNSTSFSLNLFSWNTSSVTNMYRMFFYAGQSSTSFSLDLSSWDTSSATDMRDMFQSSGVKTVYVGNGWTTANVTSSDRMFNSGYSNNGGNLPITGGAGTIWNKNNPTDKTYAHIDGGTENPGYFTYKCYENCSAKAILSDDGMLNFIYDNKNYGSGTTEDPFVTNYSYQIEPTAPAQTPTITAVYSVPINSYYSNKPSWASNDNIISANFESSFKEFKPTSTAYWFYYDKYLSTITNAENLDTSSVANMSNMFYHAGENSTTFSLNLSAWNTSSVTNMSNMFLYAGYNSTTWSVGNLSSWDTSKVTDMSFMFCQAGYNSTTFSLDLSSWNTSNVTNMSWMFSSAGYNSTTFSLNLSAWDTSNVANMYSIFSNAGQYSTTWSVGDLSSWDTSKVTNMGSMFCQTGINSTTWSVGDLSSWNTSSVTNMSYMFSNAGQYSTTWSVGDLSSWNINNVTNMNAMFSGAGNNSTTWSIGNINTKYITAENSPTGEAYTAWDTSSVVDMSGMFSSAGRNSATFSLDLSSWDTSSVTNMSAMFNSAGRNSATFSLDLSSWDTSKVTNMWTMFGNAGENSTSFSLDLSAWDTSSVTNMKDMFARAGRNSTAFSLDLSSWNTGNVTNMSAMFQDSGVKTVYVGNGWTTANVTNSDGMFSINYTGSNPPITGGAGTTWNSSNPTDKTYARVDRPDLGQPGYFTLGTATSSSNGGGSSSARAALLGLQPIEGFDASTSEADQSESETEEGNTEPLGVEEKTGEKLLILAISLPFVLLILPLLTIFIIRKKKEHDEQYIECI